MHGLCSRLNFLCPICAFLVRKALTTEDTEVHRGGNQLRASRTAFNNEDKPSLTSLPKCTRNARRPRSARTWKSPRACAALTTPKVYFAPGTCTSLALSHVICRNTPLLGPPL